MNNIMDEREASLKQKIGRNGFLAEMIYLLGFNIYNIFMLKDKWMSDYLMIYTSATIILLVLIYLLVSKKSGMSISFSPRYLRNDELEKHRLNKVFSYTGIILLISSLIALLSKVIMDMPKQYQTIDLYFIGVYAFTLILSSLYYKDITLPKNVENLEEYFNNPKIRVKGYIKEAFISTIGWTIVVQLLIQEELIDFTANAYLNLGISILIRFIVFLTLDYLFGEANVKRAKQLEKEIND